MKWIKRAAAAALCFGVALSGVACGNGDKGANGKPTAMGRYVETALSAPAEGEFGRQSLYSNADGSLDYCGVDAKTKKLVWAHSADGNTWEQKDTSWYDELAKGGFVLNTMDRSESGVLYLLGTAGAEGLALYRVENGTPARMTIPSWAEKSDQSGAFYGSLGGAVSIGIPSGGETDDSDQSASDSKEGENGKKDGVFIAGKDGITTDSGKESEMTRGQSLIPLKIVALDDGDILIAYWSEPVTRYDGATGIVKAQYGAKVSDFIVNGEKLFAVDSEEKNITAFNLETAAAGENISMANIAGQNNVLASGGDQGIYLCNSKGIHRLAPGGSVWETLMESNLSSLNVPSLIFGSFAPDQKGGFYLAFSKYDGGIKLVRTAFDPNMPSVPDTELRVYSLYDNNTVRQAISDFQQSHPNVMVNFQVGITDESSATVSDVIRALSTEILAGKGPDVLILDGLPVDSYLEKGVLADLTDLMENLPSGSKLVDNIVSGVNRDGKTRAIPMRFTVPMLFGGKETLDSVQSIADLANAKGELPALKINDPDSFLKELMDTSYPAWIQGDGSLDTVKVTEFLTSAKQVYDKYHLSAGDGMFAITISSSGGGSAYQMSESMVNYIMGQTSLYFTNVSSSGSFDPGERIANDDPIITSGSQGKGTAGNTMAKPFPGQAKNVYVPAVMAGVNAAGKQQDLAREFIRAMLDPNVQGYDFGDGLPVNSGSLQNILNDKELKNATAMTGPVSEAIKNASVPVIADRVVQEAILKEGNALLAGDKTVEQAVNDILSAVKLYLAE